jgi:hypothetical protein
MVTAHTRSFTMRRLHAYAAPLLLLFGSVLPAQAAEGIVSALAGCHQGEVSDGSTRHPITTRFDREGGGSYTFAYEGEAVHGSLAACRTVTPGHLHCRWGDRFGTGDLHVQADADGRGFRARWRSDGIEGELDWDGRRVACLDGPE